MRQIVHTVEIEALKSDYLESSVAVYINGSPEPIVMNLISREIRESFNTASKMLNRGDVIRFTLSQIPEFKSNGVKS